MAKAIYPGSFDPVTRGHLDVIHRACDIFEEVLVAVGNNPSKSPLFTSEERADMIRGETVGLPHLSVVRFDGLLIDFARRHAPCVVLRGLRTVAEFDAEFQMALSNRAASPDVETLFMLPSPLYAFHTANLIKQLAGGGADLDAFLTPAVAARLRDRLAQGGAP